MVYLSCVNLANLNHMCYAHILHDTELTQLAVGKCKKWKKRHGRETWVLYMSLGILLCALAYLYTSSDRQKVLCCFLLKNFPLFKHYLLRTNCAKVGTFGIIGHL